MEHAEVVIIGSGAAGATAAGTLGNAGFPGRVVVLRGEPHLPYNRTTVNKAMLQGSVTATAVTLPEAEAPGVEWNDVDRAVALDPAARTVTLAGGRQMHYERLIIATGSEPHPFPGELTGPGIRDRVLTLRTAADTERLRGLLDGFADGESGARVTILGAGLIGAETASVLRGAGAEVHLVSLSLAPMSEHLGATVGGYLAGLHRHHVDAWFGQTITHAEVGPAGDVIATLTGGERLVSDILLVSIGVRPSIGWLGGSGLEIADGIAVDERLRAPGASGVYAAGDIARVTVEGRHGHRVEHWNHAVAQGRHAALSLTHDAGLGPDPGPFELVPSYSTQLYGTRVAIVGHPAVIAAETLLDGDPEQGKFTVGLADHEGRLSGVVGVGGARVANALKPAVAARTSLSAVRDSLSAGAGLPG